MKSLKACRLELTNYLLNTSFFKFNFTHLSKAKVTVELLVNQLIQGSAATLPISAAK